MADTRINRKLAAILAADVVGYSRLMGADEAGTLAALKRHRETIFDPAVAARNGRIVKLIGDGAIVEFGSVVDAVNCALSVQRSSALPDANARQPTIVLRIGINLGDVIIEDEDIYGDGVNIAARLEPLRRAWWDLRFLDRPRKRRQSDRRSFPGWRRHKCQEYRSPDPNLEVASR
jgi:class 3 adenylate cyclase